MKKYNILILEDDLETVSLLLKELTLLQKSISPKDIFVTTFSEYTYVEKYINLLPANTFDVILLDRDCCLGGSFHVLDIEKFGPERIISISSTPKWNEEAQARGITNVFLKEFDKLELFSKKVVSKVSQLLMAQK